VPTNQNNIGDETTTQPGRTVAGRPFAQLYTRVLCGSTPNTGVAGFRSVGAIVVPGSMTRTIGPLNTVVVGPTGTVDVVLDAGVGGAGTDVDGATTVATGPVAERGSRPDTRVAMQSTPGR
jgi:hypothetical protein